MLNKILFFIFFIGFLFSSSIVGKYSATTDGGYYTHYLEFYSNGTYSSKIFGESSWGDWIESGDYIKLYSSGYNIENLYLSDNSFYFGGVEFTKIQKTYDYNSKKLENTPIGTWSGLVNSIYGESIYKITFYSDGSYFETFNGNTTSGDWEIKSNEIILTDSSGMPAWSAEIYNNIITLRSTSPYVNSFSIELNKK
tara:strand:- start:1985 stop:2572 length:588 start_codon:yes stop_codon:yes gene_type:complete